MIAQTAGRMNFQHGETYLSPSIQTAVRYATSKRYGSELLTYALEFLQLLLFKDLGRVQGDLYRKYPEIFTLVEVSPAPLVFEVIGLTAADLLAEDGGTPDRNLQYLIETIEENITHVDVLLQQVNFRLRLPAGNLRLRCWFVCITEAQFPTQKYELCPMETERAPRAV